MRNHYRVSRANLRIGGPVTATSTGATVAALLVAALLTSCSPGTASSHPPIQAHRPQPPGSTISSTSSTVSPSSTTAAPSRHTTACADQSVIAGWPTAAKAAQVVAVPILDGDPAAIAVAVSGHAGGMLLLGPTPPGPQLAAALRPAVTGAPPRPFVMVDQEGGGAQRLGADVQSMPWPRRMAATMTPTQVTQLARSVGRQMAALGVGVDLAPVLDLDGGTQLSASDPDGPRSFGPDPAVATTYGESFVAGLQSGGVLAVIKHFPGLGGATGNTDYGPASTEPIGQLQAGGLLPFQRAITAGARAVMIANATVPGLTTIPASLSTAAVTGLLRDRLHFDGLVMTDSLSAGAVRSAGYDLPSAAVAAVRAGADMVLFGSTLTPADTAALAPAPLAAQTQELVEAITRAVSAGTLPASRLDAAVLHIVQAKGIDLCAGSRA